MLTDPQRTPTTRPATGSIRSWGAALAFAAVGAAFLDLSGPPFGAPVRWLDLAALLALARGAWSVRAAGGWRAWRTPFDARVLAASVVGVVGLWLPGDAHGREWLHQFLAAGAIYYGLSATLRREERGQDGVWVAFAIGAVALSARALVAATGGPAGLASFEARSDVAWAAEHGVARALVLASLLTAGRALEDGASPAWRLAAFVGGAGSVLCGFAGGLGLTPGSLSRLNEPISFSTTCVLALMLVSFARAAWATGRERPAERPRWRMLAAVAGGLVFLSAFGATVGGEGLRALAALAGALVVASREAPPAEAAMAPQEEEPLRRAA